MIPGDPAEELAVPYGRCACCHAEWRTLEDIGFGPGYAQIGGRNCPHKGKGYGI